MVLLPGRAIQVGHLHPIETQLPDKGAQREAAVFGRVRFVIRCVLRPTAHLPVAPSFGVGFEQQVRRLEDQPGVQDAIEKRHQHHLALDKATLEHLRTGTPFRIRKTDVRGRHPEAGPELDIKVARDDEITSGS